MTQYSGFWGASTLGGRGCSWATSSPYIVLVHIAGLGDAYSSGRVGLRLVRRSA